MRIQSFFKTNVSESWVRIRIGAGKVDSLKDKAGGIADCDISKGYVQRYEE